MKGKVYIEYDNGTTEVIGNVDENDYVRIIKGRSLKEKVQFAKNDKLKDFFKVNGGFINLYYGEWMKDIDPQQFFRVLYLATYMDYDERDGALVKHGRNNKIEYLTRTEIKDMLNLSPSTIKIFLSYTKEHDLITSKDKKYYINSKYMNKGKSRKEGSTRIFTKTIRSLYEKSDSREHKRLGRLYKLAGFTNKKYNILCTNIDETDIDKIKPIDMSDVCEITGLAVDKKSRHQIYHRISQFTLDGEVETDLLKRIKTDNPLLKNKLLINPKLFYAGGSINSIKLILKYMDINNSEKLDLETAELSTIEKKSKGEEKIEQYLKDNNIEYIPQKKFIDLVSDKDKLLPYDFYLVNRNIIIEFDGKQHDEYIPYFHKSKKAFEELVKRDKLKNKYATDNGIKLIRIKEHDYDNIEDILNKELNIGSDF